MSENSVPAPRSDGCLRYFTLRRALVHTGILAYCLVLFLVFDFAYSSLTRGEERERPARIANPAYDHGFAANFDGYDVWGEVRYRLVTNSLGFKDASVREVPLKSASRRILLIGDSFAEGIGMNFEKLLRRPARTAPDRSAARKSNSSTPASHPIRRASITRRSSICIESGLQFDEVVLFSDTSDVTDEATLLFLHRRRSEIPGALHAPSEGSMPPVASPTEEADFLIDRFVVTNRVRIYIKRSIQSFLGNRRRAINTDHSPHRLDHSGPRRLPMTISRSASRAASRDRCRTCGGFSICWRPRHIPLTIVVYPWAQQIAQGDRDSRQVALWRDFCPGRCKAFINLFPAFFAAADADKDWYEHLYILGDDHFSAAGNRFMFRELAKHLL